MKKLHRVLTALAVGAFAATTVAVPAQAANDADVTVTVVDRAGNAVSDIYVGFGYGQSGDDVGTTNSSGVLTGTGFRTGKATLVAYDNDDDRLDAGTDFAPVIRPIDLRSGSQDISVVLDKGSILQGRVLAPSGRPVRNVSVDALRGGYYESTSNAYTNANGVYRMTGVGLGKPEIWVTRKALDDDYTSLYRAWGNTPTITTAGSVVNFDVKNVQVVCDTRALAVSSPKKGQVTISVKAAAPSLGLANPKGKIYVKSGSKTIKTFYVNGAVQSITLSKQALGKKLYFSASYGAGDCIGWSSTKSVVVKKK